MNLPIPCRIDGVPGLWALPVYMLDAPEAAATLVVGPDPRRHTHPDMGDLERRFAEWDAQWAPVAKERALARQRAEGGQP